MQLRFSARSSHHCSEYVANSFGRYLPRCSQILLEGAVEHLNFFMKCFLIPRSITNYLLKRLLKLKTGNFETINSINAAHSTKQIPEN